MSITTAIQNMVQAAEDGLNRRWGYGQAINVIGDDLAARVRRQISKYYAALASNDNRQIELHGNAMLKAFAAVDAEAVRLYGEPHDRTDDRDDVMICRLKSGDVVHIVRDGEDAERITKDGGLAFTPDELALCAEAAPGWAILIETKKRFGNATVKRAEKPLGDEFWERGGDSIPF